MLDSGDYSHIPGISGYRTPHLSFVVPSLRSALFFFVAKWSAPLASCYVHSTMPFARAQKSWCCNTFSSISKYSSALFTSYKSILVVVFHRYDWVYHSQIDWYQTKAKEIQGGRNTPQDSIAFLHIPTPEWVRCLPHTLLVTKSYHRFLS